MKNLKTLVLLLLITVLTLKTYSQYTVKGNSGYIYLYDYPSLAKCNYNYDTTWLITTDSIQEKSILTKFNCSGLAEDDTFFVYSGNSTSGSLLEIITKSQEPKYVNIKGSEILVRFKATHQNCLRNWHVYFTTLRDPILSLSSNNIVLPNDSALSFEFYIYSNTFTSLATDADWIHINQKEGIGQRYIIAQITSKNNTGTNRDANIFINGHDVESSTIHVRQNYSEDSSYFYLSKIYASNLLQVNANIPWEAKGPSWMNIVPQKDTSSITIIKLNPSINPTIFGRSDTISITPKNLTSHKITYTQSGAFPSLGFKRFTGIYNTTDLYLSNEAKSIGKIPVIANCPWSVSLTDTSWVTCNKQSGFLTDTLILTSKIPNLDSALRTTRITVSGSGKISSKNIYQFGVKPTLIFPLTSFGIGLSNDINVVDSMEIFSNTNWSIVENCSWLDIQPKTGEGNGWLYFYTNSINNSVYQRDTIIQINYGNLFKITPKIYQAGVEIRFSYSPKAIGVLNGDGKDTAWIEVKSNIDWFTRVKNPHPHNGNYQDPTYLWILPKVLKIDSDTYKLGISAEPNPTETKRTGYIHLCYGSAFDPIAFSIEVQQEGFYRILNLSADTITFSPKGNDTVKLSIQSNSSWWLENKSSWLSFYPLKNFHNLILGNGNDTLTIISTPNLTDTLRIEKSRFTYGNKSKEITFIQKGENTLFNCLTDTLDLNCFSPKKLVINANTRWKLKTSEWIIMDKYFGFGNDTIGLSVLGDSSTPEIGYIEISCGLDFNTKKQIVIYKVCSTTAKNEITSEQEFSVFPNPSSGVFYIKQNLIKNQRLNILIINNKGIISYKTFTNSEYTLLNISHLPKGIYILQIGNQSKRFYTKIKIE